MFKILLNLPGELNVLALLSNSNAETAKLKRLFLDT